MIETREMTRADIALVDPLLMEAYRNPQGYAARLERLLALGPGNWLIALEGDRAAGTGGITAMGTACYVGLVAVATELQRRGVATLVMRRLLEIAAARGCATVLLDASPAGLPLYERLGFTAEDGVRLWKRGEGAGAERDAAPAPGRPREPGIELSTLAGENAWRGHPSASLLPELAAFDTWAFGADRSAVLASFIADDPALVALARGPAGELRGYALVQAGPGVIGPWVASDGAAGRALLAWALSLPSPPGIAYLPDANGEGAAALAAAGFAPVRRNTHMRLGPALPAARRRLVWSQASFALG